MKFQRMTVWLGLLALVLVLTGCFEITSVNQPASVRPGARFTVTLEVKTSGKDENPHFGIVAVKIPQDWAVVSVKMAGDYGRDTFKHLPADVADGDPGGKVDYWQPELERRWAPEPGMQWLVYQTTKGYKATKEVAFADVSIELKAGTKTGQYSLDYFVTNAALDFTDPSWYAIKQGNKVEVK
jgi:hypothetical protein